MNEATLDLTATGISEYSNHIVHIQNEKVLPVCAIFGANASGKSNIYQAFQFMTFFVLDSFKFGGSEDEKHDDDNSFPTIPSFAFVKDGDKESSFEVFFTLSNQKESYKTYNYGFALDKAGIVEEWLYEKRKPKGKNRCIFFRNRNNSILEMDGLTSSQQENIKTSLEKEVLLISLGAKLKIEKCKEVRQWFYNNETFDFGSNLELVYRSRNLPNNFPDSLTQDKVLKFLKSFDESIKGFSIQETHDDENKDKDNAQYIVKSLHKGIDTDELFGINLQQESAGTLKMFTMYQALIDVLENGSVFFVDELNARLHPLLVRNLVLLFINPGTNPHQAQLIFITHDTWHLSNNLLRRDEIWFTEKNPAGCSTLYSLAEFICEDGGKVRKDEQYEKNYLLGKYHAIPSLKTFNLIFDDFQ